MKVLGIAIVIFSAGVILACSSGQEPQIADNIKTISQEPDMIEPSADVSDVVGDEVKVKISTAMGDMVIKLYNETPLHRDNFIKLVNEQFYDSLLFHRVMNQFMIQGGDPKSKNADPSQRLGGGGPGYTIPAEILPQFIHKKGALAAARQPDRVNPEKRSSGSQFYIVQGRQFDAATVDKMAASANSRLPADQQIFYTDEEKETYSTIGGYPSLDGGYTVFGEIVSGLEVVDKIAATRTDPNNRPLEDIRMFLEIVK